jgi:hypothetical protein
MYGSQLMSTDEIIPPFFPPSVTAYTALRCVLHAKAVPSGFKKGTSLSGSIRIFGGK